MSSGRRTTDASGVCAMPTLPMAKVQIKTESTTCRFIAHLSSGLLETWQPLAPAMQRPASMRGRRASSDAGLEHGRYDFTGYRAKQFFSCQPEFFEHRAVARTSLQAIKTCDRRIHE